MLSAVARRVSAVVPRIATSRVAASGSKLVVKPAGRWYSQGRPTFLERARSPRTWVILGVLGVGGSVYYMTHLEDVPITGRRHMVDVSPDQELIIGDREFQRICAEYRDKLVSPDHKAAKMIRDVGMRIVKASNIPDIQNLKWEFAIINDDKLNAMVLPGGKVVVFTGIIPVMKNVDGAAVVLGHEIGHVVARHTAEKLTFAKVLIMLSLALSVFIDSQALINIITQFAVELPFSRKTESEADHIGMVLMSRACFNPNEALAFWERMDAEGARQGGPSGNSNLTEFLGTHPSHSHRRGDIQKMLPAILAERAQYCDHIVDSVKRVPRFTDDNVVAPAAAPKGIVGKRPAPVPEPMPVPTRPPQQKPKEKWGDYY